MDKGGRTDRSGRTDKSGKAEIISFRQIII